MFSWWENKLFISKSTHYQGLIYPEVFFFYVVLYGYENKEGDNGMQMLRVVSLIQGESLIWV